MTTYLLMIIYILMGGIVAFKIYQSTKDSTINADALATIVFFVWPPVLVYHLIKKIFFKPW